MARRSVTGQLNMFELLNSLEEAASGDVEMVSLVPVFDEEVDQNVEVVLEDERLKDGTQQEGGAYEKIQPEVSEDTRTDSQRLSQDADKPVMSRSYEVGGKNVEVAYLNYNKVRITRTGEEPEVKVFASSKEAVDYYVQMMQEWEKDEE